MTKGLVSALEQFSPYIVGEILKNGQRDGGGAVGDDVRPKGDRFEEREASGQNVYTVRNDQIK